MSQFSPENFLAYWSAPEVGTNLVIFLNILGSLVLGLILGYERSFHGRAAGMRTYGLVCMGAAALTVMAGYPGYWYAGQAAIAPGVDPTRIIQGIVTGIGFLGAGVIMKEGMNISGLTTAASIWSASAVGILVGVGFYAAAMLLTLLSTTCMWWISRVEKWLPSHPAMAVTVSFKEAFIPDEQALRRIVGDRGYDMIVDSLVISVQNRKPEWHFVAIARDGRLAHPPAILAADLSRLDGVENFQIAPTRN